MENQENQNCPINPIQNPNFYSPYKESPMKFAHQVKDNKYFFQSSPFQSNINSTPGKKLEYANNFCTSLGETPLPINYNLQFSPYINNNNRVDTSYQKNQYTSSPFRPLFNSPINNQRISDKK